MGPNLVATWAPTADAKEWVVAGAHLDSRSEDNQSETDRAPGADDNGEEVRVRVRVRVRSGPLLALLLTLDGLMQTGMVASAQQ